MAKDTEEINMDEFLNLDLAADNESSGTSDHVDELAEDVKLANQEKSKPLAQAPPLKEVVPPAFAVDKSNVPMNVDKPTKEKNNTDAVEDGSTNKQDEDDDLVYEVEAIVDHRLKKSKLEYLIKWKGYPHEENTWEDQDNLFCNGLIGEYWDQKERLAEQEKDRTLRLLANRKKTSSPGQLKSAAKERIRKASSPDSVNNDARSVHDDTRENGGSKKRSRSDDGERKITKSSSHIAKRRNVNESDDEQPELQSATREQSITASPSAQAADDDNFVPAEISGSWEPHIEEVQTVQMSDDGQLMVYLNWKNGHVTMHSAKLANAKCPQKVIQFYEKRLQFSSSKKKD